MRVWDSRVRNNKMIVIEDHIPNFIVTWILNNVKETVKVREAQLDAMRRLKKPDLDKKTK